MSCRRSLSKQFRQASSLLLDRRSRHRRAALQDELVQHEIGDEEAENQKVRARVHAHSAICLTARYAAQ